MTMTMRIYIVRTSDGLEVLTGDAEKEAFEDALPCGRRLEYVDGIYKDDVTIRYMRIHDRRKER